MTYGMEGTLGPNLQTIPQRTTPASNRVNLARPDTMLVLPMHHLVLW